MKRPRIALWIKWRYSGTNWIGYRPKCPNWLWRWAVRRVDRWQKHRDRVAIACIREMQPNIREGFARLARLRKELEDDRDVP